MEMQDEAIQEKKNWKKKTASPYPPCHLWFHQPVLHFLLQHILLSITKLRNIAIN
jgi:hypothetical protein